MTVFLEGREPLRSAAALGCAHRGPSRRHRPAGAGDLARACRRRWKDWRASASRCRRPLRATAADIRAQLAWLVPAGFLLATPWERLKEFPRYLQAIEQRLEKLGWIRAAMRSWPPRSRRWKPAIASA